MRGGKRLNGGTLVKQGNILWENKRLNRGDLVKGLNVKVKMSSIINRGEKKMKSLKIYKPKIKNKVILRKEKSKRKR